MMYYLFGGSYYYPAGGMSDLKDQIQAPNLTAARINLALLFNLQGAVLRYCGDLPPFDAGEVQLDA